MNIPFRPRSLRTRLTAWYVGMLALVLLVFVAGTSGVMYTQLRAQLERQIAQDLDTIRELVAFDQYGHPYFREENQRPPESRFVSDRYVELVGPAGESLFNSGRLTDGPLGVLRNPAGHDLEAVTEEGRLADGTRFLVGSRSHIFDRFPAVLRVAYSTEPIHLRVADWVTDTLLSLGVMLVVAGIAAYQMARRALVPIDRMASQVAAISPDRLHERLPAQGVDDELAHLAQVFNGLLARVEEAFERLRRFTADASHELRTPLASIRIVGEVGLQRSSSPEGLRDVIGSMLEETNRLTVLVDSLLDLARADRRTLTLQRAPLPVLSLVRDVTGLVDVLVEDKGQRLELSGDAGAMVSGDAVLLRQALVNVVHNAVKYSPMGGTIRVDVRRTADRHVVVEVADSGPGIAPEHQARLFDRFYRVEQERSRDGEAGGTGLGLSIARWTVEAHGGTIDLESAPGHGATFRITLPEAA